MKWFPTVEPRESTPEEVRRCRSLGKTMSYAFFFDLFLALCALVVILLGWLPRVVAAPLIAFLMALVALTGSIAGSELRAAALHERVMNLEARIKDLTPTEKGNA